MRSHVGWGGEQNILYKGVETSLLQTHFENAEGKPKRKNPKKTISASGRLWLLQMVSEPDTERCAKGEAESQREVDTRRRASKGAGL